MSEIRCVMCGDGPFQSKFVLSKHLEREHGISYKKYVSRYIRKEWKKIKAPAPLPQNNITPSKIGKCLGCNGHV